MYLLLLVVPPSSHFADAILQQIHSTAIQVRAEAGISAALHRLHEWMVTGESLTAVLLPPAGRWTLSAAQQMRLLDPDVHLVFLTEREGDEPLAGLLLDPLVGRHCSILSLDGDMAAFSKRLEEIAVKVGRRESPTAPASDDVERARVRKKRRKLEHDVKAWQARLLQQADDAIFSADAEGCIVTWNPAAERIFGWSAAEATGRSLDFFLPFPPAQGVASLIRLVQQSPQPVVLEIGWPPAAPTRELDVKLVGLRSDDQAFLGIGAIARAH